VPPANSSTPSPNVLAAATVPALLTVPAAAKT
jgi:hypothetical protein